MNGFTNSVLSLLLNWIRTLIASLWRLFTSEDGGTLYRFFSENWLVMLAVLCIGGVAIDWIVYLFRWRPYYVWFSRLRRRQSMDDEAYPEELPQAEPYAEPSGMTDPYAPMAYATRVYAPVQEDAVQEDSVLWDADEPLDLELEDADHAEAFGAPRPEPRYSYQHIQAGYAPAVPPQQLYTPSPSYQPPMPEPASVQVHPGLNDDIMRQSFGLFDEEQPPQRPESIVMRAPAFRPFTAVEESDSAMKTPGALSRLARRARNFVSMEDGENGPTFRDLQSTVDVSKAFHAPVYPQPMNHEEG